MKHKIIRVEYRTKQGIQLDGYFIKAVTGLVPLLIERDVSDCTFHKEINRKEIGEIDVEL